MNGWLKVSMAAALLAAGCASYDGRGLVPGSSTAAEVEALMGPPAAKVPLAAGETEWFYPRQPDGRQTYAATIGPDGVLRSLEQRLTMANVARLKAGVSTKADVTRIFGPPWRIDEFPRLKREVWDYRMYDPPHVYVLWVQFSADGVVREVINDIDLDAEPSGPATRF